MITRIIAIKNLKRYIGQDLSLLAPDFGITVYLNGKQNKGRKGLVLERLAGLSNNNEKAPNGLGFELKSVAFYKKNGILIPKETMAITMINPTELSIDSFYKSHCWEKLKSLVFCAVSWEQRNQASSKLLDVTSFDFQNNKKLIDEIEQDYEYIREKLKNQGFSSLTGKDGKWIQARTKGTGGVNPRTGERRPITRAFYARKDLVKVIFG